LGLPRKPEAGFPKLKALAYPELSLSSCAVLLLLPEILWILPDEGMAGKQYLKQKRCRRLAVFRLGISSGSLLTRSLL
jgi:hypothetical protein